MCYFMIVGDSVHAFVYFLGPPVAIMQRVRPYVFASVSFFFFFSARSPQSLGHSPRNFAT